jgi:hypothetical protein
MKTTYEGEMQLMNWGESSNSGAWVKFWIPPEGLESFRDLRTKSGKIAGHRMMAVLVEIGDDEQPLQREEVKEEKLKGGELARMAGVFCNDPDFWQFIKVPASASGYEKDWCRNFICAKCDIDSRTKLDHDPIAANKFHELFRKPFNEWRGK